jgi:hypothetical protein
MFLLCCCFLQRVRVPLQTFIRDQLMSGAATSPESIDASVNRLTTDITDYINTVVV